LCLQNIEPQALTGKIQKTWKLQGGRISEAVLRGHSPQTFHVRGLAQIFSDQFAQNPVFKELIGFELRLCLQNLEPQALTGKI
jgi:hypothetical protein